MNVSYDYYRIFYYVAKHGSFTKAAVALLNNQPNITRTIKTLESALGCTLFTRTNKGVTLTPEGKMLYSHISLAFEHIRTGEEELSANKGLQNGTVSIGATEISLRCFLLPILNDYRKKYPGIHIKISNLSTPQALSSLKDSLVDFAIVTTPIEKHTEFDIIKVKEFREVAVCGEDFRQTFGNRKVTLNDLAQYPIVSLEKGCSTHTFYSQLFAKEKLNFSPEIETATAYQIMPIVRHNLGIGFVPEQFLYDEPNGIYGLNLNLPLPARDICVITDKTHSAGPAAKELGKMITEHSI